VKPIILPNYGDGDKLDDDVPPQIKPIPFQSDENQQNSNTGQTKPMPTQITGNTATGGQTKPIILPISQPLNGKGDNSDPSTGVNKPAPGPNSGK